MANWYETGYSGAEEERERQRMGNPPDRLWQKPGTGRDMVFIDDDPFCIREHGWKDSNNRYKNATCIASISDECPACSAKGTVSPAAYVGHYTIVDVTGFTTRDGHEHKYRLILLPAKTKVLNKFKFKKEQRGTLLNSLFNLARSDSNSPNTGDDLEFMRDVEMDKLYSVVTYKGKKIKELIDEANAGGSKGDETRRYLAHHFDIPSSGPIPEKIPSFNYQVLLQPVEPSVMRSIISDAQPFQGGGANSSSSSSVQGTDDIPF